MSRAKNWCFTLNNYSQDDIDRLSAARPDISYLIAGKEVGDSGTPHLQGFFSCATQLRLRAAKALIGEAHLTVARNVPNSIAYCKKDGDFFEIGQAPPTKGSRSDLELFKTFVQEHDGTPSLATLREHFSDVCAKYPRFVESYLRDKLPPVPFQAHPLHDWQQRLNESLLREPDDRQVTFVVDTVGNQGKSWFAKYYMSLHDNAFLMRPGKHADMAYTLPLTLRVLFLDCTRSQLDYLPYTFLEELKDGYVQSTKYECVIKQYPAVHVVVLMNQDPDMNALSADRYHLINL